MIAELVWSFVTGLAGSLHCLGMCGPLLAAYSLQFRKNGSPTGRSGLSWSSGFSHHLAFHLGRTVTYGILGGSAGAVVFFCGTSWPLLTARNIFALIGGILLILLGLVLLKAFPLSFLLSRADLFFPSRLIARLLSSGRASGWLIGFAAGFLPCMLSSAMVVKAAITGNPLEGFLIMALFGLGTMPLLLFSGMSFSLLSLRMRMLGERAAALSVILMGLVLVWRGAFSLA